MKSCIIYDCNQMLGKNGDNGLFSRGALGSNLYLFTFWDGLDKGGIMNFDNFFVGKGQEGISKLEYVISRGGDLSIGFSRIFSLSLLLFQAFPNFFYLFARKSLRDGWGNSLHRISFASILIPRCQVTELQLYFVSEGVFIRHE